jgi:hypothetical protein
LFDQEYFELLDIADNAARRRQPAARTNNNHNTNDHKHHSNQTSLSRRQQTSSVHLVAFAAIDWLPLTPLDAAAATAPIDAPFAFWRGQMKDMEIELAVRGKNKNRNRSVNRLLSDIPTFALGEPGNIDDDDDDADADDDLPPPSPLPPRPTPIALPPPLPLAPLAPPPATMPTLPMLPEPPLSMLVSTLAGLLALVPTPPPFARVRVLYTAKRRRVGTISV